MSCDGCPRGKVYKQRRPVKGTKYSRPLLKDTTVKGTPPDENAFFFTGMVPRRMDDIRGVSI